MSRDLSSMGLSIISGIEEEGNILPFVPYETYLGSNGSILDGLYVYLGRPNGLEFGERMRKEASHNAP